MRVFYRTVMHDLVETALQKRGVHREHREHSLHGKACGESHRVLLRYADIEKAFRAGVLEVVHAGGILHRRSDAAYAAVGFAYALKLPAEGFGERLAGGRRAFLCDRMVLAGVLLRRLPALSLRGEHMHNAGSAHYLRDL